jgi:hypothetical protein
VWHFVFYDHRIYKSYYSWITIQIGIIAIIKSNLTHINQYFLIRLTTWIEEFMAFSDFWLKSIHKFNFFYSNLFHTFYFSVFRSNSKNTLGRIPVVKYYIHYLHNFCHLSFYFSSLRRYSNWSVSILQTGISSCLLSCIITKEYAFLPRKSTFFFKFLKLKFTYHFFIITLIYNV